VVTEAIYKYKKTLRLHRDPCASGCAFETWGGWRSGLVQEARCYNQGPAAGTAAIMNRNLLATLLDSMNELADSAAKKMTPEEMGKTAKEINKSIEKVVAEGRRRRRGTA
jgi:hypothetical protein